MYRSDGLTDFSIAIEIYTLYIEMKRESESMYQCIHPTT